MGREEEWCVYVQEREAQSNCRQSNGNWLEDELLMGFHVVFVVVCFAGHEHNKSNNNNHESHGFSLRRAGASGRVGREYWEGNARVSSSSQRNLLRCMIGHFE